MPTANTAVATRISSPPAIDGRDDDSVWSTVPPITQFREWAPKPRQEPRFPTYAKVAYDAANLYVFVRACDPEPGKVIRLLERRDTSTPSDMVWILIDSQHDRRTGYEFGVNAAGVKADQAVYNDNSEDSAWDGIWDVATSVDSAGWTAEFRIPLSQLRYAAAASNTFGLAIDRELYRYNERISWPMFDQSKPGMVSQFGTLTGLDGLAAPRPLEAVPYMVTKSGARIAGSRYETRSSATAGGDVKYRMTSNLTLAATINPDFGEVEADPAVLNLTTYESFFPEQRPFFVAGRGLLRFDVNCNVVTCSNEGLYYSRRIGRAPRLASAYGDTVPQVPTTILGAAKLQGRFSNGITLSVLDAVTQRAEGPLGKTFEPSANYTVARATADFRGGRSTIGAIATAVNRSNDQWSAPYLASGAYTAGLDFRHRFLHDTYEVSGSLDGSDVRGTSAAIAALQSNPVHYFGMPGSGLRLDPEATSLTGDAEELRFGKVAGQRFQYQTSYQRRSAGFEINDLGYLRRADQQSWNTWIGLFDLRQRKYWNNLQWNNNWTQHWTTTGLALDAAFNTNLRVTTRNNWSLLGGSTFGQLGATYDDRLAHGGPAVRNDPYVAPYLNVYGDDRRAVVPGINLTYYVGAGGRNSRLSVIPSAAFKAAGRFSATAGLQWTRTIADNQWYGNVSDGTGLHWLHAHLDQVTAAATLRANYTFTPNVSLQAYVQPFVSKGTYSNLRQLSADPRAAHYNDRYAPYTGSADASDPGGFNYKQFASNLVFRWEYMPGSTLFLVWNEGRQGMTGEEGAAGYGGDVNDLFRLHPVNTFAMKVSYWFNR
ncbi:MAG: carbohydrate binding family 9 domain-containing protein [Gemmatimonadaceae bacterium]|nr:carbohydrate binding family 9 domain-containing protein [Gemmatimonadaceae bacterium]